MKSEGSGFKSNVKSEVAWSVFNIYLNIYDRVRNMNPTQAHPKANVAVEYATFSSNESLFIAHYLFMSLAVADCGRTVTLHDKFYSITYEGVGMLYTCIDAATNSEKTLIRTCTLNGVWSDTAKLCYGKYHHL